MVPMADDMTGCGVLETPRGVLDWLSDLSLWQGNNLLILHNKMLHVLVHLA